MRASSDAKIIQGSERFLPSCPTLKLRSNPRIANSRRRRSRSDLLSQLLDICFFTTRTYYVTPVVSVLVKAAIIAMCFFASADATVQAGPDFFVPPVATDYNVPPELRRPDKDWLVTCHQAVAYRRCAQEVLLDFVKTTGGPRASSTSESSYFKGSVDHGVTTLSVVTATRKKSSAAPVAAQMNQNRKRYYAASAKHRNRVKTVLLQRLLKRRGTSEDFLATLNPEEHFCSKKEEFAEGKFEMLNENIRRKDSKCTIDNFKRNRHYRLILEHVTPQEGYENHAYVKALLRGMRRTSSTRTRAESGTTSRADQHSNSHSLLFDRDSVLWQHLRRTNGIGGPLLADFQDPVGKISPTMVRYVRELLDLHPVVEALLAKSSEEDVVEQTPASTINLRSAGVAVASASASKPQPGTIRIAEIGVGHGGFAFCFFSVYGKERIKSYTFADLPEVEDLAYLATSQLLAYSEEEEEVLVSPQVQSATAASGSSGGVDHGSQEEQLGSSAAVLSNMPELKLFSDEGAGDKEASSSSSSPKNNSSPPIVQVHYDLCVSNHAFSELRSRDIADHYVRNLFRYCKFVSLRYTKDFHSEAIDIEGEYLPKIRTAMGGGGGGEEDITTSTSTRVTVHTYNSVPPPHGAGVGAVAKVAVLWRTDLLPGLEFLPVTSSRTRTSSERETEELSISRNYTARVRHSFSQT
ncbi:unnamed protein product [Amoebophrya sp. A120]|nr:unnamed protein product [Amoebophrya sp. A120]|eukprot:GSA120T00008674001.1